MGRWVLVALGALALQEGQALGQEKLTAAALTERIDRRLDLALTEKGIEAAPRADDAEFLRRVYLDLVGRVPRVAEVRDFLDDAAADKRSRLIERLLGSPQYVNHFGATWRNLILPTTNNQFAFFGGVFKPWIEQQVQKNTPYDEMVRTILTTPLNDPTVRGRQVVQMGNPQQASPIAFFQANELKAENLAASATRIFLGVKLECAQCHDHPFAKWSREQFWETAAFFATVQPPQQPLVTGKTPKLPTPPKAREIKIAGTEKVVQARFLTGDEPKWQEGVDPRITLANWITSPENPYFARTAVNRVWTHLFGVGLIDPVDDEPTDDNPIRHPELLDELSRQFVANNFDVKYLIRAIVNTKAYQRTSMQTHAAQADSRDFARMSVRGLTPEQLFDSIALATGYKEPQGPQQGRVVVIGGPNNARADFLNRFAGQERATERQTSILQALALMNGKFVADATSIERSTTLMAVADAPFLGSTQKIETLYLATLSRFPRADEVERLTVYLNQGGARGDERRALSDIFWALLNSSEFILNH